MSSYPRYVECTHCKGKGEFPVRREAKCPACQARRWSEASQQPVSCPTCAGTGKVTVDATERCKKCLGRGGRVVLSVEEEGSFTGIDPVTGEAAVQFKAEEKPRERRALDQEVSAQSQKQEPMPATGRRENLAIAIALSTAGCALWLVTFLVLNGTLPCRSALIIPLLGVAAFVIFSLVGRR